MTLAAVALLAAAAWAVGSIALARVDWSGTRSFEQIALEATAGLGLVALLLAVLALADTFSYAAPILAGLAIAGLWRAATFTYSLPSRDGSRPSALWIAAAVAIVCAALGAIAPVTDDDALAFGLPCANHIAATGQLRVWSDQARSMFPQAQMVLLAFAVRLGGDRLGAVTGLEWLLCAGVMSALARRVCTRAGHVPVAITLALGSPVMAFQVASAKEDLLVYAAGLASTFFLVRDDATADACAAGLCAGLAAGAKYSGLGFVLAAVVWSLRPRRDWRAGRAVAVALFAAIGGGLWYWLNWHRFGNPIAPFVFGAGSTHFDAALAGDFSNSFGAGRGVFDFVAAPIRIFVDPQRFSGRGNLFNPMAYGGVAALALGATRRRHGALLFTAAVLYVGWFSSLQNARLLAPAVALLAPAAADLLVPIMARRRASMLAGSLAVALSLGIVAAVGVTRTVRYLRDPTSYLQRETQRYDDIDWMNRNLNPARDRVASSVKVIGYLTIPSLILDPTRQVEIAAYEFDPPQRLLGALRRQHVTHVFGAAGDFDAFGTDVRLVHGNAQSRLGGVRFFHEPPTEATAVYEIVDPSVW